MEPHVPVRIGIFIDGRHFNIARSYYYTTHPVRRLIQHQDLVDLVHSKIEYGLGIPRGQSVIVLQNFYIGVRDTKKAKQDEWFLALRDTPAVVHFFPLKGSGGKRKEQGVDVAIGADMVLSLGESKLDVVVLISGDGDFIPVVERIRRRHKRVVLLHWNRDNLKQGDSTSTSQDLIQSVDLAMNMAQILDSGIKDGNEDVLSIFGAEPLELHMGIVQEMHLRHGYIRPLLGGKSLLFLGTNMVSKVAPKTKIVGRIVEYNIIKGKGGGQDHVINVKLSIKKSVTQTE